MKRLLTSVLLIFSFLSFVNTVSGQTLDNTRINDCTLPPPGCQEVPICTLSDDCFVFDLFAPKDQGNGTSIIKFKITNFSESTFKQAAFELPGNGTATNPAIAPINKFRNRYNHNVINPFDDSMIVFNAINAGTFSYGGFEVYYYIVNNADLNAPSGRNVVVKAHAGRSWQLQRFGTVTFNLDECLGACPTVLNTPCIKEDCCFRVTLFGSQISAGPGQFSPFFEVLNTCGENVTSITFSTPETATDPVAAERTYTITTAANLLTFANPDIPFAVSGDLDQFLYLLSAAAVEAPGGNMVTVTVNTSSGAHAFEFDLLTQDEDCGITPLPVELLNFRGVTTKEGIALTWKTATETNNDRFEIERSLDGRKFTKIGTVKGSGNSTNLLEYGFLDKDPGNGVNYYRLNQVDTDGKASHSPIIKINTNDREKATLVQLIPNPCNGESCTVHLKGFTSTNMLTVELRDLTGRVVFSKQLSGDQTSFELPRITTGDGVYILSAGDGSHTTYQKVVIQ